MKKLLLFLALPISLLAYDVSEWETFEEGSRERRFYSNGGQHFMTESRVIGSELKESGYIIGFPYHKADERIQILLNFREQNLELISSRQHGDDFAFFITKDLNGDGYLDLIDLSSEDQIALYLIKKGKVRPVEKVFIEKLETGEVNTNALLLDLLEKMD